MSLQAALETVRNIIWGPPLLLLLLGTGVFLTIRLRGIQFRYFGEALRLLFWRPGSHPGSRQRRKLQGDLTPFQALTTALAATIGIGNIGGVAIAVTVGGVGSLFWMVVAAIIGMATSYTEAFLAVRFRMKGAQGEMMGGPMLVLQRGCNSKTLALLFCVGGAIAALTTGNMVQSNSIASILGSVTPVPSVIIGGILTALVAAVLFGGIRKIGKVTGVLVPLMALLYLGGGVVIILLRLWELPNALMLLFKSAWMPKAVAGGSIGTSFLMALRMGVTKGLLASEAGLGSAPIAAAAAKTDNPGRQALISMTGSFFSVCIVCLVTGLVLTMTGSIGKGGVLSGVPLTVKAFGSVLPWSRFIVILGAILFGYSTILGWAYYGEKCCEYLFGGQRRSLFVYRVLFLCCVLLGAVLNLQVVWSLADISNAIMAVPNLVGLLLLSSMVAKETTPFLKVMRAELV